jgi:hypothetical protein
VTQIVSASGVYTYGYSTYLGGSGSESGNGIAVDHAGAAYVVGSTSSSDFPTCHATQTDQGDTDVFVAKITVSYRLYLPLVMREYQ